MAFVPDIDLNLLRLLDTLYEERSVARTADRLFLTPSAVSHALKRLRILFGDEMFVRGAGGMVPTARAHLAAQSLRTLLPQLNEVIHTPLFDPETSERAFTIATVPYLASVFLPGTASLLGNLAPRVSLDVRHLSAGLVGDLDSGVLDLALGNFRKTPDRLVLEEVFRDPYVWVIARSNPHLEADLDIAAIGALPHVELNLDVAPPWSGEHYDARQGLERLIVQDNLSMVENDLAKLGLRRQVACRVPDSIAAMAMVAQTNAIALIPSRAADRFADGFGLAVRPSPFETGSLVIQMLYHRDVATRPSTAWLIEIVRRNATSFLA